MSSVYESFPVRASPKSHRTGRLPFHIQRSSGPGRVLVSKMIVCSVIFLALGFLISASSESLRTVGSATRRRMFFAWMSRDRGELEDGVIKIESNLRE